MKPLRNKDLVSADDLTRAYFRATNPQRTEHVFDAKWWIALGSPFSFFRAFPQAYWVDVNQIADERLPAVEVSNMLYGDAHPENFGYLTFKEGTHFVYNDLDDVDRGNAALDALRYFTATVLESGDKDELDMLICEYCDVMQSLAPAKSPPASLFPDIEALRDEELRYYVKDNRFLTNEDTLLTALRPDDRDRVVISGAVRSSASTWLRTLNILDIVEREKQYGGSGGLRRFWLLATNPENGREDIVEIKELDEPGPAWGDPYSPLEDRVETGKAELWNGLTAQDHFTLVIATTPFLVRSRLGRKNIKLGKLSDQDRLGVLLAEVGIMALHHRKAYKPAEYPLVCDWLLGSARTMRKRWRSVWERLSEE